MALHNTPLVAQIHQAALARRVEDRAAFLAEACAGDESLRRDVEALLATSIATGALLAGLADPATEAPTAASPPSVTSPPPKRDFTGTTRFELRRWLGQGGFGTVYEVLDRERGAPVALKLLHNADPAALYRFKREFRTLADLTHLNLVALDELFSEGDQWFFTMELIHGQPITEFIRHAPSAILGARRERERPRDHGFERLESWSSAQRHAAGSR